MKDSTRSILIVAISCIIILLIIAGVVLWHSMPKKMKPPAAPTVGIAKVVESQHQQILQVIGSLAAIHGVKLRAPTAGMVTAIHFKSNQMVKAGQLLVEVDPGQLQAQLASDRAQQALDELTYQREIKVVGQSITQSGIDTIRADIEKDKAAVAQDKANLNNVLLKAPFAGKLGIRRVQVGQYLSQGDEISALEQVNPLWVNFTVPSRYLGQIKVGQRINVQNDAWPEKKFSGEVTAISSLVATESDSVAMRGQIANSDQALLPGQLVNIKLLLGQAQAAMVIPTAAVMYSKKGTTVYRVEQGKAVITPVKLGAQSGDGLMVLSGLKVGDTIVVAGGNKIHGNHSKIKGVSATAVKQQPQQTAPSKKSS